MRRMPRLSSRARFAAVATLLVATALAGGLVFALSRDGEEPQTRAGRWQADLRFLEREMRARHPDVFFSLPEEEFERRVDLLAHRIPSLTDAELVFEFASLVASISAKGRDGHSHVHVLFGALPTPSEVFPLRLYWFSDGLVVADAMEPYDELIGWRVVGIGASTIDQAIEAVSPAIALDNEMTFRARVPLFLVSATLLEGAGVVPAAAPVRWRLADERNEELVREIAPVEERAFLSWLFARSPRGVLPPVEGKPTPFALRNLEEAFWASLVPGSNVLYVGYNEVREETRSGESLAEFARRLVRLANHHGVEHVVIDLRYNDGGDNTTYGPLLETLGDEAIDRTGRLFALIGRRTFSAAGNFATELERTTGAVFVGEPAGTSPNEYGDADPFRLPHSGLVVGISTRYHEKSEPDDARLTIEPDLPVPLSSEEYFAGRDPALDAILEPTAD
ncbi:MAG: hypothetical protein ACRDNY_04485 [Gaiellaceae bacterium]